MMRRLTIREVFAAIEPDLALTPESTERVRAALAGAGPSTPWYLRLLMGIGAWVATWFMLAFVLGFLALILEDHLDAAAVVAGLGLVAGATALSRLRRNEFLAILALIVSLTGQGMVIGGIGSMTDSIHAAALAGLLLSIALILLFDDRIHRFLSTVGLVAALAVLPFDAKVPHGCEAIVIGLLAAALAIWRGLPLAWRTEHAEVLQPVASGAIVSALGLLLISSLLGFADLNPAPWLHIGGPVTAAAVLGLLWLVWEVGDAHEAGRFGAPTIAASASVVALAAVTWRTPEIVTTLLIVLLAFDRRSRTLLGLGIAFFLAFGALYYYNLEMTLLTKSGILAGSGVLCLAAWFAVRQFSRAEEARA